MTDLFFVEVTQPYNNGARLVIASRHEGLGFETTIYTANAPIGPSEAARFLSALRDDFCYFKLSDLRPFIVETSERRGFITAEESNLFHIGLFCTKADALWLSRKQHLGEPRGKVIDFQSTDLITASTAKFFCCNAATAQFTPMFQGHALFDPDGTKIASISQQNEAVLESSFDASKHVPPASAGRPAQRSYASSWYPKAAND